MNTSNKSSAQESDRERLMALYDLYSGAEQDELLYTLTRKRLTSYVPTEYDADPGIPDEDYYHEEFEQWLIEICPFDILGNYFGDTERIREMVSLAWGGARRVLLGTSSRDGASADVLYAVAMNMWPSIARNICETTATPGINLQTVVEFIQAWRNEVLAHVFRREEQPPSFW